MDCFSKGIWGKSLTSTERSYESNMRIYQFRQYISPGNFCLIIISMGNLRGVIRQDF